MASRSANVAKVNRFAVFMALVVLNCHLARNGVMAGDAHATYYGGNDASGTNNGACGYSNVFSLGYGSLTTALSGVLFNDGLACGGCYSLSCAGDSACLGGTVTVTATNLCPQGSFGGWCDNPNAHFDLSYPAFQSIAQVSAGHIAISYQKVSCSRSGGIKFQISGHTYFFQLLVYNVAGAGDVNAVFVRGTSSSAFLTRNWGQIYSTGTIFDGQPLSISVTTSDGRTVTSNNVAGSGWSYGQTFEGEQF